MMRLLWQCLFSPRVFRVYNEGAANVIYEPNKMEKYADKVIVSTKTILNISYYTSPIICMYILKRGFFSFSELKFMGNVFGGICCLLALSLALRSFGRATNPKYVKFLRTLNSRSVSQLGYFDRIRKYDFDFSAWPVNYQVENRIQKSRWSLGNPFKSCANSDLPIYQRIPLQLLAFCAIHTFGLRLIYPGTLALIQKILGGSLISGRTQLVEGFQGCRAKLATADGNNIDTMYIENGKHGRGRILVICCEGNSGFYEVGLMTIPAKCGYSTLGWNHPGFAGSTGLPFPSQERNAIDAVMKYAIHGLHYSPENIVLFGWSIGGYTAAWAAINYPIKALVLDATFDDILYLAQNQMPTSWSLLVKEVIRSYVDMNIADLLRRFNGTVQLIRRTDDEVICLKHGLVGTNRGNYLVTDLIMHRHPELFESGPTARLTLQKYVSMLEAQRVDVDTSKEEELRLLQLIAQYMCDFEGSHCTPMSEEMFVQIMERVGPAVE